VPQNYCCSFAVNPKRLKNTALAKLGANLVSLVKINSHENLFLAVELSLSMRDKPDQLWRFDFLVPLLQALEFLIIFL